MSRSGFALQKRLLPCHDCCPVATLSEDLTVSTATPCARRFLATPLDEIIPSWAIGYGAREGEGNPVFFKILFFRV